MPLPCSLSASCTHYLLLRTGLGPMPPHVVPSRECYSRSITAFVVDACHTAFASAFFRSFGRCPYGCVRILKDRFLSRPSAPYSGREGVSPYRNACAAISALVLDNSLDESLHERYNPYAFTNQATSSPSFLQSQRRSSLIAYGFIEYRRDDEFFLDWLLRNF